MTPPDAVAGYLAGHGWPRAEYTMRGITGTGRILWDASPLAAEHAGDTLIADWVEDTRRSARRRGAFIGVLVTPQKDYGTNRVASWWAHVDIGALAHVMRGALDLPAEAASGPVRMHLSTAAVLLRSAGLGAPLPVSEVAG